MPRDSPVGPVVSVDHKGSELEEHQFSMGDLSGNIYKFSFVNVVGSGEGRLVFASSQ